MADNDSPSDDRSSYQRALAEVGPYLGLGIQLGATMVFFTGGGYLLDEWLGTSPWLLLVGAVLGMTSLIIQLYQLTGDLNDDERSQNRRKSGIDEE